MATAVILHKELLPVQNASPKLVIETRAESLTIRMELVNSLIGDPA